MFELQLIRRHRNYALVVILIIFSIALILYPQVDSYDQALRCIHRCGWRHHLLSARWTSSRLLHTKYPTDWDYKRLPSDFIVGSSDAMYLRVVQDLDDDAAIHCMTFLCR